MKKIFALLSAAVLLTGCSGNTSSQPDISAAEQGSSVAEGTTAPQTTAVAPTEEPETDSRTSESAKESADNEDSVPITANYPEDVDIPENAEVFEYSAAGASQPARTIFTTASTVTGFKILSLTYDDMDEDGNIIFATEELMTIPTFTADSVLIADLEYIGEIPNNGIAYTDPITGKERRFAVNMSGKDGSLFLWEF